MKLFYTHVLRGAEHIRDVEGQQFEDLEAAYQDARGGARGLVADEIYAARDPVKLEYYICDEAGAQLASFTVSATVTGLD